MLSYFQTFSILTLFILIIYIINLYYLKWNIDTKEKKLLLIKNIIASILISFGLIKLYNLYEFVSIFSKYDIITQYLPIYAYIFPFLEILLGLSIIIIKKNIYIQKIYQMIVLYTIINLIGIYNGLQSKIPLKCGCMGSYFDLPLSNLTIIENLMILIKTIILIYFTS